jgi:hypothetical protein
LMDAVSKVGAWAAASVASNVTKAGTWSFFINDFVIPRQARRQAESLAPSP